MKKSPCLSPVLAGIVAGGLYSTLLAQTTPPSPSAPAAEPAVASIAAPTRPARAPQQIGGIQAISTKTAYKFFFGAGDTPEGFTKVTSEMAYNDTRVYGFDSNSTVSLVSKAETGKSAVNLATNEKQFFFSVALPEGNYKVTVTLGHPDTATNQFVKAELHRLMLENVATKPGEYVTKTFIVNVHTPAYSGGRVSPLKGSRETMDEAWSWDNGLTLEFSGDHPSVAGLAIEKVDVPTIYLIGDSTSCDQMADPYSSWGGMITNFLKPEVAFCNLGESGETLAGTLGEHRFDKVWSQIKPGEYLFLQFGHNDMKSNAPNALDTFKANLQRVATETRSRKGNIVFITPVSRASPQSGFKGYVEAMKEVAEAEKVPLLDLNASSQVLYTAFGGGETAHKLLFAYMTNGSLDPTHHNRLGSYEISKTVLSGMQELKLDLTQYIVDGFSFDPAKPDKVESFKVPPSTNIAADKPPGS